MARSPNVLLVVLDAARRDALTPYGAPAGATPAIAELARRGRALSRAYATSSWTLPSHASMFAGRLPRALGLSQPPDGTPQSAKSVLTALSERLLPAVLRNAGYETHGFSANAWVSEHTGLATGFDTFTSAGNDRVERNNRLLAGGLRGRLGWMLEGLRSRGDDGALELGRALRERIASSPGAPGFWFVNLVECHSPYLPPRPWNDLGPRERIRAAIDAERYMGFEAICVQATGHGEIPPESMARMRHLYDRSVAYMDAWLADVFQTLSTNGILDETLVIVTADHGESFGEDGLVAHGFSLGQQLINVPCVIAGPGTPERDAIFSLAELPGLIAAAAGIDGPWRADDLPAGSVAVAQYDPMAPPEDPRIVAFAEKFGIGEQGVRRLTASVSAATDGDYKLVRTTEERFYDLRTDPHERAPLRADAVPDEIAAILRGALAHEAPDAAPGADPSTGDPAAASPEELAALEQQMKLLGYM
ncbi:MAG: sulfatase [Solirubrobacteraceae bacterium]